MTWLRIDDQFPEHPKIAPLSDRAFRYHVSALCYCARNLTNGLLRERDLRVVIAQLGWRNPHKWAEELVTHGLWKPTNDGYEIHGYLDYNPTAEAVKRERDKARERMQRLRGSGERSGEHDDMFGRTSGRTEESRSGERTGERSGTPSRPQVQPSSVSLDAVNGASPTEPEDDLAFLDDPPPAERHNDELTPQEREAQLRIVRLAILNQKRRAVGAPELDELPDEGETA